MKKRLSFLLISSLLGLALHATETKVTPADYVATYNAAADGDILLLDAGTYSSPIAIQESKTITLKAAPDAATQPTVSFTLGVAGNGGSIAFEGLLIDRGNSYFIDYAASTPVYSIGAITMKNCTIQNVNRCFLRTSNAANGTIDKIEFDNCLISNCGSGGYNFIYPTHSVKAVTVRNSTLSNYTGGESFFLPNAKNVNNVLAFTFENNTVYKWAKSSDRALCNVGGNYSSQSTFVFSNNIITEPGVAGQQPKLLNSTNGGTLTAQHNLMVNYGGYTLTGAGAVSNVSDLALNSGVLTGITSIPFNAPAVGDFTILSSSPLATAGTGGKCLGNPRWIKTVTNGVTIDVSASPEAAGTVAPTQTTVNEGEQVTLTAAANFGYAFAQWADDKGNLLSTDNPYTFTASEDLTVKAVFQTLTTYTLNLIKEGAGAKWGKVELSPLPNGNRYVAGTEVTATIPNLRVAPFLYWGDNSTDRSRKVPMEGDRTLTAVFDQIPFIVGWDFNNPSSVRNNRPNDFYSNSQNTATFCMWDRNINADNSWGGSTATFGEVTYDCARRYTDWDKMEESKLRYFYTSFRATGYENIEIQSKVAFDNNNVYSRQKMQYSLDNVAYTDLTTIDLTGKSGQWLDFNATLPTTLTEAEKERVYIRWIPDVTSPILGAPLTSGIENFYIAEVYVLAEKINIPDPYAPELLSSVPAANTNTASANGRIVLNFNEPIKLDKGDCTLNGKALTAKVGTQSVSFEYHDMAYGSACTFVVPANAITDQSGNAFAGLTLNFSIMERPQPTPRLFDAVVAQDGSGDYTTIQAMIDAMPDHRTEPWLVFVKTGRYEEMITIPATKRFLHLIGEDKEKVVTTYKVYSGPRHELDKNDPSGSEYDIAGNKNGSSVIYSQAPDFYAENISFENRWGVETQNGPQALALKTFADRFAFYNCNMRSFQDTWQTTSTDNQRHFAYKCWIEGAVDYVYNRGNVWVEQSTFYNVRSGSVIVAPSHSSASKYGYIFMDCTVDGNEAAADGKLSLGRPWHNAPMTSWVNTRMMIPVSAAGWTNMGTIPNIFAEYKSVNKEGELLDLSGRKTEFSYTDDLGQTVTGKANKTILTDADIADYTYENVVMATDRWNPRAYFEPVNAPTGLAVTGNTVSWNPSDYAICYLVFKNGSLIGFSKTTDYTFAAALQTGDKITMKAANEYGSLSIRSAEFTVGMTNIRSTTDGNALSVIFAEGSIRIENATVGTTVRVTTVEGQPIYNGTVQKNCFAIACRNARGVVLVNIGEESFKLIAR